MPEGSRPSKQCAVALRKESVDRNPGFAKYAYGRINVALRKESVDRNYARGAKLTGTMPSLSARRAWIEMFSVREVFANFEGVALRKESVDRNLKRLKIMKNRRSRSPQGERG